MFRKWIVFLRSEINDHIQGLYAAIPGRIGMSLRRMFYRKRLRKCGEGVIFYEGIVIYHPENVVVGNNLVVSRGTLIYGHGGVTFGNDVMIGPYTVIHSANHIYADARRLIQSQGLEQAPIIIEDDVWVAAQVTILPGVCVSKGSVVAAGAVVTKNVPPYSLVGGVPARVIKSR